MAVAIFRTIFSILRGVHNQQRGIIYYWFAMLLPVFCGMAALTVDLGGMWQTRRQLQNCADAAALAGAWELGSTVNARTYALTYLANQGASCGDTAAATLGYIDRDADGTADALEVTVFKPNPVSFARVLGFETSTVQARAVGGKVTPSSFMGLEPFGLQVDAGQGCGRADVTRYTVGGVPLTYGNIYTIKYGASGHDSSSPGNFQPLALGGTGANNYRDNVAHGYQGWISSCNTVTTETGNKVGPTLQGLDTHLVNQALAAQECSDVLNGAPVQLSACPRVLNIAIIPPLGNGRTDTQVLTFGWFYLLDYASQGNSSAELTGIFLDVADRHAPPGTWKGNGVWNPDSSFPSAVRLIE